jgi:3-deoxy-D-manno-octulosonic-acid transferase
MIFWLYRTLLRLSEPLIILWLWKRKRSGKEDANRLDERFGFTSAKRPYGDLVWFHAASVGEALSILPLLETLYKARPETPFLLTTGTKTSADLVARDFPQFIIHQYIPIDHPTFAKRFVEHWRPTASFFVESDLWPTLIRTAKNNGSYLGLINARISNDSFNSWKKRPRVFKSIISMFDLVLAQDDTSAKRLAELTDLKIMEAGNLKLDAPAPGCDAKRLKRVQTGIGERPVWLAASTHSGEEQIILNCHKQLAIKFPDLLTLIVPRHPDRAEAICALPEMAGLNTIRFSQTKQITQNHNIMIGDTVGDMGLYYRLAQLCFIGGTLIDHGGQNPLEAARLDCAITHGPSTSNFTEIFQGLHDAGGAKQVTAMSLGENIDALLSDDKQRKALQKNALSVANSQTGTTDRVAHLILEHIPDMALEISETRHA